LHSIFNYRDVRNKKADINVPTNFQKHLVNYEGKNGQRNFFEGKKLKVH